MAAMHEAFVRLAKLRSVRVNSTGSLDGVDGARNACSRRRHVKMALSNIHEKSATNGQGKG
jgi:hypothetical protein